MRDATRELPGESILRTWLDDPDLTVFCGDWNNGAVMELLPRGGAELSGSRYESPFDGLRELRLRSGSHHVHLDFGRLTRVFYLIAPSVCYGFRPSFEIRFTCESTDPRTCPGLGLALSHPYSGGKPRTVAIRRYLHRAHAHTSAFPGSVEFQCDRTVKPGNVFDDWHGIDILMAEIFGAGGQAGSYRSPLSYVSATTAAVPG